MLVDQNDPNILTFSCECVECLDNCRFLGFAVTDKKVSLRVWRLGDMTDARKKKSCY
jgi:hypothetical protein